MLARRLEQATPSNEAREKACCTVGRQPIETVWHACCASLSFHLLTNQRIALMDPKQLPASPYFSVARPPALELPHLITALDAEFIGKLVHLTKSEPGLWPVPAPFEEHDV